MQQFEVAILFWSPPFVQLIKLAIESKERPENGWIEKVDDRIELVDPIFDRRSGQHEGIAALQSFDSLGSFRTPVFNPLRRVGNPDVRSQQAIYFKRVANHLFVIHDRKKRGILERA